MGAFCSHLPPSPTSWQMKGRTLKRRTIYLLFALTLGAFANVAVCWVLALWTPSLLERAERVRLDREFLARRAPPGATDPVVFAFARSEYKSYWIAYGTLKPIAKNVDWNVEVEQTGWPMRAMESRYLLEFDASGATTRSHTGCVRLNIGPSRFLKTEGVSYSNLVPLRPLPLGFIVNSVLYASILLSLVAALFAIRRTLRRRRNLCPACAYNLAGLSPASTTCPECGKPVRPAAGESGVEKGSEA